MQEEKPLSEYLEDARAALSIGNYVGCIDQSNLVLQRDKNNKEALILKGDEEAAERMRDGDLNFKLRDSNGNTVGQAKEEKGKEPAPKKPSGRPAGTAKRETDRGLEP